MGGSHEEEKKKRKKRKGRTGSKLAKKHYPHFKLNRNCFALTTPETESMANPFGIRGKSEEQP